MRMSHVTTSSSSPTLWQSVFPDNGSLLTARAVGACRPQVAEFPGPTLGGPKLDTLAAIAQRRKSTTSSKSRQETGLVVWGHVLGAEQFIRETAQGVAEPKHFGSRNNFARISSDSSDQLSSS